MLEDRNVKTTCPECQAPITYPRDATEFSCECGNKRVKIRVALPIAWNQLGEFLWARSLGEERYELDTIPFCAYGLSGGDVVRAVVPLGRPESVPEVVEVVKACGRKTFWVRFLPPNPEFARDLLDRLPADVGREIGDGILALDALPDRIDELVEILTSAQESEQLAFQSSEPNTPGRFDNVGEDLLGEYFVLLRREEPEEPPVDPPPESPSPQDLQSEAMESYLLAKLGWPRDGPPRALRLRPLTSREIRARSGGRVELPRTINPNSLTPKHRGLFAPEVWGHTAGPSPQGLLDTYGDFKRPLRELKGFDGPPGHVELPVPVRHPWLPGLYLDAIPVLPPGCRPVFFLPPEEDEDPPGPLVVADVNYLYMLLLDRTHKADVTPEQLQEAVDALFANEVSSDPFTLQGRAVASLRKQLGDTPGHDLVAFDEGLESGALRLAGPLPKRTFHALRTLEALGMAVEARSSA